MYVHCICTLLWNLSIKDPLNKGHLSIKDTCSHPSVMHCCITYLNSQLKTPPYKGQLQRSQWCPVQRSSTVVGWAHSVKLSLSLQG